MQNRKESALEVGLNVFSGMVVAFLIFQVASIISANTGWYRVDVGVTENVVMTTILTVVSIIRTYLWRRYFNSRENKDL